MPIGAFASASCTQKSGQQDSIVAQPAYDLPVPWGGVLSTDQLAQAFQQRVMNVNSPPPLISGSNFANDTPYPAATANAGFYTYPGIRRSGGFMTSGSSLPADVSTMPTVANVPVPNLPALETPAPVERANDSLEVSNPALQAVVQSYIY